MVGLVIWPGWLVLWSSPQRFGQAAGRDIGSTHGCRAIRAVLIEEPIQVDGRLNESNWVRAPLCISESSVATTIPLVSLRTNAAAIIH